MTTRGIRISDGEGDVLRVKLSDILNTISNGKLFHWAILYLWATGDLGEGKSMPAFEESIKNSEKGLLISWEDIQLLSKQFYQVIEIGLIGCKNKSLLHRYKDNHVMYEQCDIVIEMIDSSYWEVFSKDPDLIERLGEKFKQIEFLSSDIK